MNDNRILATCELRDSVADRVRTYIRPHKLGPKRFVNLKKRRTHQLSGMRQNLSSNFAGFALCFRSFKMYENTIKNVRYIETCGKFVFRSVTGTIVK